MDAYRVVLTAQFATLDGLLESARRLEAEVGSRRSLAQHVGAILGTRRSLKQQVAILAGEVPA